MIDYSLVKLTPADELHREFSYLVKKAAYGDYINEIWGWDEGRQREFHTQDWLNKRPAIILYDNQPIGTIYINENEDYIELQQFIILSEYQNKGIGSYILQGILDEADSSGQIVKLKYLRSNPVASLYSRMGFQVVDNDDLFISVERKPGSKAWNTRRLFLTFSGR